MPRTKSEPVQYTRADGSVWVVSKKQINLVDFLDRLEKKRDSNNKIETLGLFNGHVVSLYQIVYSLLHDL